MSQAYHVTIIKDKNLATAMDSEILPFLSSIQTCGKTVGGLYFEAYYTPSAIGAIVISHGFCESIEKYKEVIFYFVKAGYQVYLADHRGHGRSLRETSHPNMVHINRFSDYVEDLHAFICDKVLPWTGSLPLYLYAHSMGGAIGCLYLETYPDTFQKAILNAPMLRVYLGPLPDWAAMMITFAFRLLGKGEAYAPGQHPFKPMEPYTESGSACEQRYRYYQDKKDACPQLQTCGASNNWVLEALRSCRKMLKKKSCRKIKIPVFVFQAEQDTFIDPSGITRFLKYTGSAKTLRLKDCKHEIYNSPEAVLKGYYQAIFQFLQCPTQTDT